MGNADPILTDKWLHGVGHFVRSEAPAEFCDVLESWRAELVES
ncbi:hypothetical protein [Mycobacterium sp. D16R24]|nr:hypothetical protein [Mycobacterium sp. D16R24]